MDGGFDGSTLSFALSRRDQRRYAYFRITEELTISDQIADDKLVEIATLIGLPRLRAMIDEEGVDAFFASPTPVKIDLTTETVAKGVVAGLDQHKQCHFQERRKGGLVCEVATPENLGIRLLPKNQTTRPVCDACGHPDDRLRCSELMHVSTEAGLIGPSGYHREASGTCNLGYEVFGEGVALSVEQAKHQIGRCRLGERDCARSSWTFVGLPALATEDAGQRLVDALDYLDLVVNARFAIHPLEIRDAATIAALVADASTREQFTLAHAALVGLLNGLAWPKIDHPGSINALEAFALSKRVPLDGAAIATLRAVVALRQAPPIHNAATEAARAASQLGFDYPVSDPRQAWRIVRAKTAAALRSVADALRWTGADSGVP